MMWTCAAKDYFFGIDQVEKKISFMTYFDWKYYKELLIGNKELGKVQREFTVVVIKIKNVSAFIGEFFSSQFVYVQKK